MSKGAIMGLVFAVAVAALVVVAMRGLRQITCEVCVTFDGETLCRTGTGKDRKGAIDSAQRACCALLSSGMTESIKCGDTEPSSVSCD
jgi:hypothetical protein